MRADEADEAERSSGLLVFSILLLYYLDVFLLLLLILPHGFSAHKSLAILRE